MEYNAHALHLVLVCRTILGETVRCATRESDLVANVLCRTCRWRWKESTSSIFRRAQRPSLFLVDSMLFVLVCDCPVRSAGCWFGRRTFGGCGGNVELTEVTSTSAGCVQLLVASVKLTDGSFVSASAGVHGQNDGAEHFSAPSRRCLKRLRMTILSAQAGFACARPTGARSDWGAGGMVVLVCRGRRAHRPERTVVAKPRARQRAMTPPWVACVDHR